MSAIEQRTWTVEEYLAFERASDFKHEYLDGQIYAMTGASFNHNRIVASMTGALVAGLSSGPCEPFASDTRVKVSATGLYTYPDITVVCGQLQAEQGAFDTLLNPTLIVEVLSPSTEAYDRGKKFEHYKQIPSLREYVLVAQDRARVERYVRQDDGQWLYADTTAMDEPFALASVGCTLLLRDVYANVDFSESGDTDTTGQQPSQ